MAYVLCEPLTWDLLPDNLLLDVFKYLHTTDLLSAAK